MAVWGILEIDFLDDGDAVRQIRIGRAQHARETVTFPNGAPTRESPETRTPAGASETPEAEVIEVDPAAGKDHRRIKDNPRDRTIERMEAPGR